jgi:hypothetical protein
MFHRGEVRPTHATGFTAWALDHKGTCCSMVKGHSLIYFPSHQHLGTEKGQLLCCLGLRTIETVPEFVREVQPHCLCTMEALNSHC